MEMIKVLVFYHNQCSNTEKIAASVKEYFSDRKYSEEPKDVSMMFVNMEKFFEIREVQVCIMNNLYGFTKFVETTGIRRNRQKIRKIFGNIKMNFTKYSTIRTALNREHYLKCSLQPLNSDTDLDYIKTITQQIYDTLGISPSMFDTSTATGLKQKLEFERLFGKADSINE